MEVDRAAGLERLHDDSRDWAGCGIADNTEHGEGHAPFEGQSGLSAALHVGRRRLSLSRQDPFGIGSLDDHLTFNQRFRGGRDGGNPNDCEETK